MVESTSAKKITRLLDVFSRFMVRNLIPLYANGFTHLPIVDS